MASLLLLNAVGQTLQRHGIIANGWLWRDSSEEPTAPSCGCGDGQLRRREQLFGRFLLIRER